MLNEGAAEPSGFVVGSVRDFKLDTIESKDLDSCGVESPVYFFSKRRCFNIFFLNQFEWPTGIQKHILSSRQ